MINLDSELKKEIKKLFDVPDVRAMEFKEKFRNAAKMLSNRYRFDEALKEHSRAVVSLCCAATMTTASGYEPHQLAWANAILSLLTDHQKRIVMGCGVFNLHPAILADNTAMLRKYTVE